jgi:hypothetical protein
VTQEKPHDEQLPEARSNEAPAQESEASKPAIVQPQREKIYERSSTEGALRQGEILSDLVQLNLVLESLNSHEGPLFEPVTHPYAIIVTQDCDIIQDFAPRQSQAQSDKLIPSVFFCEVITAEELRGRGGIDSQLWRRIKQNKDERYQFLEKIAPDDDLLNQGLPELGIDFKRYFTMPTAEVYLRLGLEAQRRSRLVNPYLEHFINRFCHFQGRVALPAEHRSE